MNQKLFDNWLEFVRRVESLARILEQLDIDQHSLMPQANAIIRGTERAVIAELHHRELTEPRFVALTHELSSANGLDEVQRGCVEAMRRQMDRALRIPKELIMRIEQAAAPLSVSWRRARETGDSREYRTLMPEMIALRREQASALADLFAHPYDALLDEHEPGMTTAALLSLLEQQHAVIRPILERVRGVSRSFIDLDAVAFTEAGVVGFGKEMAAAIGLDPQRTVFVTVPHPLCAGFSMHDVRIGIRTRYAGFRQTFCGVIHETGHALYEQGFDPDWWHTPAARAISLGMHESQSLLWERIIGMSPAFWKFAYPRLSRHFSSDPIGIGEHDLYAALNRVAPSNIRVEADYLTYPLHVLLRTKIEVALIDGDLHARDIPQTWNELSLSLLGLAPASEQAGWLQDPHWAEGVFGYFPTYSLGWLMACQLWQQVNLDIPELEAQMACGNFAPLLTWLREKVHRRGQTCTSQALIESVTGKPLGVESYRAFVQGRVHDIYGI